MNSAFVLAGQFGVTEIVLVLLVVVLLFGGRKIPELMRGLGKGIREFKDASKNPGEDTPPAAPVDKKE
jgi:sec-independent protein translocase protein TatA